MGGGGHDLDSRHHLDLMDVRARYRADVVRDARVSRRSVSTYVWWLLFDAISDRKAK